MRHHHAVGYPICRQSHVWRVTSVAFTYGNAWMGWRRDDLLKTVWLWGKHERASEGWLSLLPVHFLGNGMSVVFCIIYALKWALWTILCDLEFCGGVQSQQLMGRWTAWQRRWIDSPNSVSTLRGSYGRCKGRCLIRVLHLGRSICSSKSLWFTHQTPCLIRWFFQFPDPNDDN